jgi:hypothetical protein
MQPCLEKAETARFCRRQLAGRYAVADALLLAMLALIDLLGRGRKSHSNSRSRSSCQNEVSHEVTPSQQHGATSVEIARRTGLGNGGCCRQLQGYDFFIRRPVSELARFEHRPLRVCLIRTGALSAARTFRRIRVQAHGIHHFELIRRGQHPPHQPD